MSTVDESSPHDRSSVIRRIISLIDLTDLDDERRPDGIAELLADARRHRTAAVCVWPEFVERAAHELAMSGVRVATVANFPSGVASRDEVTAEIEASLTAGADEIDVVLPWRSFLDGDVDHARDVVRSAADLVHELPGAQLKVILETGDIADPAKIAAASKLAIDCGADFLKTSTGKTGTGATTEAVATMLEAIVDVGGTVGIKPSGGVRTISDAIGFLDLVAARIEDGWATAERFRFGASGLLADALTALDE